MPERLWAVEIAPGVGLPLLGLGTWEATGRRAHEAVLLALELGYRHVDTATFYRNEEEVGRALRDSGLPRGEVFVTTKLPASRAGHERETLEASLGALGVDQVDLWLIHWPPGGRASPVTWARCLELADEGLARAVGVSNYTLAQIDELERATGRLPAVNQIEWGPALHDEQVSSGHRSRGVQLEGYSPLKTTNLGDRRLVGIAQSYGVTPAQVVIRWHLEHDVVVIPKSTDPGRLAENLDVFGFALSAEEVRTLDGLGGRGR